ncbi:MAG TPA: MotA/TolQ/ExbB proton channel family protein [Blastocatellia bacterium]|nr:MotA/TolQ/ExbB proton channel family protein [Blastocatellia bacterium]
MFLFVSLAASSPASPATALLISLIQAAEAGSGVNLGIRQFLIDVSWTGWAVLITLLLMSIYSMAVIFERWLTFRATARQSREFVPKAAEMLKGAQLDGALRLTQDYRKSHLAVVINSGLQELAVVSGDKSARQMRRAKRALRRTAAMKTAELRRGLSSLATIGSTAPFVGLFGTVIGIIHSFEKMNEQGGAPGIATIAGGISEALYTTAFGLVVAVPAVWMFNYFSNRVGGFAVEMKNSADELIDYFFQQQQ